MTIRVSVAALALSWKTLQIHQLKPSQPCNRGKTNRLVVVSLPCTMISTMVGPWSSLAMRSSFFLYSTSIWDGSTTMVA